MEDLLLFLEVQPDLRVRFRAVRTAETVIGEDVLLPREAKDLLLVGPGERVHAVPFR